MSTDQTADSQNASNITVVKTVNDWCDKADELANDPDKPQPLVCFLPHHYTLTEPNGSAHTLLDAAKLKGDTLVRFPYASAALPEPQGNLNTTLAAFNLVKTLWESPSFAEALSVSAAELSAALESSTGSDDPTADVVELIVTKLKSALSQRPEVTEAPFSIFLAMTDPHKKFETSEYEPGETGGASGYREMDVQGSS
ncbi:hypothetical protein Q5752_003211 [Cryptotrichosporon argae]